MAAVVEHTVMPPTPATGGGLSELRDLLGADGDLVLSSADVSVTIPRQFRALLLDAVIAMADGRAVSVQPHRTVLTTQEAADFLGVTRPTLVRLLESGQIPFTRPGRHRRVQLNDVLDFRRQSRIRRRDALDEMASESTPDPGSASDGFVETR